MGIKKSPVRFLCNFSSLICHLSLRHTSRGKGGGGVGGEGKGLMTFQTITFHAHFVAGQEVQTSHLLTKS